LCAITTFEDIAISAMPGFFMGHSVVRLVGCGLKGILR